MQAIANGTSQVATRILPRNPELDYSKIPKHWLHGLALPTHVANGLNLLFPPGERFFVRSVRRFMDRVEDPVLKDQIRGFFGQEGRHAAAHERQARVVESQGFKVERFMRVYEGFAYGFLEKIAPAELSLAATAAAEHFTATFARDGLRDRILDGADPVMRKLLLWHAAEEIEHRSVAFDVLQIVNPSYALRIAGLVLASSLLSAFWLFGFLNLLVQDDEVTWQRLRREAALMRDRPNRPRSQMWSGIREYVRRDFHPSQLRDADELAHAFLAAEGMLESS